MYNDDIYTTQQKHSWLPSYFKLTVILILKYSNIKINFQIYP